MLTDINLTLAQDLLEAIKFFNQKGWSPATSTNYSVRSSKSSEYIISRSGVDKSKFRLDDLILIDHHGKVLSPDGMKSSAETEIHTAIYERFPQVNCVLHTHSVMGTVLSQEFQKEEGIFFEGLEILKAFDGNSTHEMTEFIPVVKNSQSMPEILKEMDSHFSKPIHGFLISGHGLYTWGKDIYTAKRHIEAFEFLFECFDKMRGK